MNQINQLSNSIQIYFSTNLKYLREKFEVEQSDLQKILNFKSSSTISEWETGKRVPSVDMLLRIAHYFNITLTDLIERDLTQNTIAIPNHYLTNDEKEVIELAIDVALDRYRNINKKD